MTQERDIRTWRNMLLKSSGFSTLRMPLPPPPSDALIITGKPYAVKKYLILLICSYKFILLLLHPWFSVVLKTIFDYIPNISYNKYDAKSEECKNILWKWNCFIYNMADVPRWRTYYWLWTCNFTKYINNYRSRNISIIICLPILCAACRPCSGVVTQPRANNSEDILIFLLLYSALSSEMQSQW